MPINNPNVVNGTSAGEALIGTSDIDYMYGLAGNDSLYALDGNDLLYGGAGNDRLDGGAGMDTMYGGAGNDIYIVDNAGDVVSEQQTQGVDDGGTDYVLNSISYTLGQFVERMEMQGTANIDGTGNSLANTMKGNSGDNVISGGLGSDILYGLDGNDTLIGGADKDYLYGGTGADVFIFGLNQGAADKIYDFEAVDKIGVYAAEFGLTEGAGLTNGQLSSDWFVSGSKATASGHGQFVFDPAKLTLSWDPDGAGSAAAIALTVFQNGATLDASQFSVATGLPTASISLANAGDANETDPGVYFAIKLSQPWYQDIVLTYSTADGTATAGSDFTGISGGQVVIAAGSTTAYVKVGLIDDSIAEGRETFSLHLDSAQVAGGGASVAIPTPSAQAGIIDPEDAQNTPPTIISAAAVNAAENQTFAIDVQSTDNLNSEGNGLSYSLTGGNDAALFSIDAATGVLTFKAAPDYETPADANHDNVYDVQVTVADAGALTASQNIAVTVTNVNEAPAITSAAAVDAAEHQTFAIDVQATDDTNSEGNGLSYSLTGGADAALFAINAATGVLSFKSAPVYAAPADANHDNIYDVQVSVADAGGLTASQGIAVTVLQAAVNAAPSFTSSAVIDAIENQTLAIDVQATDDTNSEGNGLSYSLTGGADAALFAINAATGVLSFNTAPVYATPTDANHDNIYDVQVSVADSGGLTTSQDISVAVQQAPSLNPIAGTDSAEDLIGTAGRDLLDGHGGNDRVYGQGEDDLLYGGAGNDIVDGGTGADTMYGGAGDDLYRIDNPGDIVSEQSVTGVDDGGTDTAESKITYALPMYVEKLTLTGTAAIDGTGNDLANRLTGNDAANVLNGGAGADIIYGKGGDDILIGAAGVDDLYGAAGADTFVFGRPDATSTDRVKDFSITDHDQIGIYASDYGLSLGNGLVDDGTGNLVLDPTYFATSTLGANFAQGTASGHGQFVFSTTASTHTLMWDADGAGPGHGISLATFNLDAAVSDADFFVFNSAPTASVNGWGDAVLQRAGAQVPFTFDLSAPWNENTVLTYSTVDGTAVAGQDYAGVSHGQVVIPAGSTSASVLINVLNADAVGSNHSFSLQLESAVGATSGTAYSITGTTADGTIAPLPPEVVKITDLTPYGIGDPFGLTYVPQLNTLFMVDPQELTRVDTLYSLNLDGTLQQDGVHSLGFSWKPAGLAYDPFSGHMYVADDESLAIQWVDPSNPTVMLGSFDASTLGISNTGDTEDVTIDPTNGHVFVVNGGDFGEPRIIETDATGSQIYNITDLKAAVVGQPIGSPEGAVYDPTRDVFFVGGNNFDIKVVDRQGTILDDFTLLQNYRNPAGNIGTEIQGLTLAPSSDPNDDPHKMNLYVADAGLLNTDGDGRLIEIDLHGAFMYV